MGTPNHFPDFALPDSINGWQIAEDDQKYSNQNLFQYINGGAELYISYGFKNSITRTYSREGHPDLIVDIFDMENSFNAFGVFNHIREEIDSSFGQGSQYSPGMLLFWKDRYYISILASPETKESKDAIFALAKHLDSSITRKGPIPEILKLLPETGLVKESVRFFFHYIWQNTHYYIADKNIFNIDQTTQAVLAKYGEHGNRIILLLIKYANAENAVQAKNQFKEEYLEDVKGLDLVQIEDGTWTGYTLNGKYLGVVFNAASESNGKELLKKIKNKIVQK